MKRTLVAILCALSIGASPLARAQETPAPAEPAGERKAADPAVAPEEPASQGQQPQASAANEVVPEAFYIKAQQWLGGSEPDAGRLLMRDLARDYPESPYGRRAKEWLDVNAGIDHSGRVEFVISSTLLGAYLGYTAVLGVTTRNDSFADDEAKTAIWSSVAGAGVGLTASVLASMKVGVSESQARIFGFLGSWGWFNGFFIYDLLEPLWDNTSDALVSGGAGMLLGMGTTIALWDKVNVETGTADLATGMAIYTTCFATLANFLVMGAQPYQEHETLATLVMLVPANLAFVGGFYLGDKLRWPSGDIRLMELGGFLGGLVGAAVLVTAQPDGSDDHVARVVAGTLAGTMAAGLGGAALILRPWEHPVSAKANKTASGLNGLLTFDGDQWDFRAPMPVVLPRDVDGKTGVGLEVPLLSVRL